jgi:putative spermidine/putrescine transport system ATP-binding protein
MVVRQRQQGHRALERVAAEVVARAGASLALAGIQKSYGPVPVLHGLDLDVRPGELLTLLGPSGSGKTTLLKVVAGFEQVSAGRVALDGRDITRLRASRRDIGMVFQNYALFPHMTVQANVAFPLEMRRQSRSDIGRRVDEVLALVNLSDLAGRFPRQLSGGQQQRVALARAVVYEPQLLLLDEPFGALDRKLRESLQLEMRALQRRLGITTVFITHDQDEALVMSDRIAVMNAGRIEQLGTPSEVYDRPATMFAAKFMGESNVFPGLLVGSGQVRLDNGLVLEVQSALPPGTRVGAMIRPERMDGGADGTQLQGTVADAVYVGVAWKYRLILQNGTEMLVRLPGGWDPAAVGDTLRVQLARRDIHVLRLD